MNGPTVPPPIPSVGSATAPPKRTGLRIYAVVVTVFFLFSLLANIVLIFVAAASLFVGEVTREKRAAKLKEVVVGGEESARNKIAIIDVDGIITSSGWREDGMVGEVKSRLEAALKDRQVKAIVLKIDSPGGEVTASDTIYQAIKRARASKPVVVHIGPVGASGAYYISMGASHIVAADTSITGSIGVIMQSLNFAGMMGKVGVEATTFKSGKNKDLLNPFRKPTPEEAEEQGKIMQALIDEFYERFLGIVAKERRLDAAELRKELADGRVLTGRQAKEARLVDSLGGFEEAIEAAKTLAKIEKAQQIKYASPFSLHQLLWWFGAKASAPTVQVNVLPRDFQLEPGKAYYLSHHLGF